MSGAPRHPRILSNMKNPNPMKLPIVATAPPPPAIPAKQAAAMKALAANPPDDRTHLALTGRLYVWDGTPPPDRSIIDSMMGR